MIQLKPKTSNLQSNIYTVTNINESTSKFETFLIDKFGSKPLGLILLGITGFIMLVIISTVIITVTYRAIEYR